MSTAPATDQTAAPYWTVGDVSVHRIDEVALPTATGSWLLPDATPDLVAGQHWLRPDFADDEGTLRIDSHSFAFTVGGSRILVDTGIGNGKERANPAWHDLRTDFLRRLTDAGFPPDSVDLVILTHLHADHVGWNTRRENGKWVPTFPNARHLTSRTEREFWAGYDMDAARTQMFRDSVFPVEEAGLLDLVDVPAEGLEVVPGPAPDPHTRSHTRPPRRRAGQPRSDGPDHRRLRPPPRPARPPRRRSLRRHRPRTVRGVPPSAARLARRHGHPRPGHPLRAAHRRPRRHARGRLPAPARPRRSGPAPVRARRRFVP
ncbi:glyoxylase-like metal-dependent hydrolase (beta-lactamase superfamily II) [Streptomyces ambofaciens]